MVAKRTLVESSFGVVAIASLYYILLTIITEPEQIIYPSSIMYIQRSGYCSQWGYDWSSGHAQSLQHIIDHFKQHVSLNKVIVYEVDKVVGV